MKIIVDVKNYARHEYIHYMSRGEEVKAPSNPEYIVGQLVVIPSDEDGKLEVAVVLGCIDVEGFEEIRTDSSGMVSIDTVKPFKLSDLEDDNVICRDVIRKEIEGFKVTRNWETFEYTIEEPA